MNDAIRSREVRLIDETGENVGVVDTNDALERAANANLDLVEISPDAEPPVCNTKASAEGMVNTRGRTSDSCSAICPIPF